MRYSASRTLSLPCGATQEEVRQEARANGISASDAEAIRPDDSGEYHRYRTSSDSDRVTVLLHMRRTENGIAFCKTTRNAVVMREKVLPIGCIR